jgi:DNA-binding NarL/FixJ family response regulator
MRPDVLILDLGASRNLMLAREVSNDAPSTRLLTISSDCVQRAPIYVEAGVTGFLSADANNTDLVRAVLVVAGGGVWCSARVAASLANALRRATNAGDQLLSRREQQIMELLQLGLSNRQIAEHLTLGLSTVKNHVHNILEKLKVTSRGEAVELWSGLDAGAYNRS